MIFFYLYISRVTILLSVFKIWISILPQGGLYHACLSHVFSDEPFDENVHCMYCIRMAFRQYAPSCAFASLGHPEKLCRTVHRDGESCLTM